MRIDKSDLHSAASKSGISQKQVEELWVHLQNRENNEISNSFDLSHILYYFGAMFVIAAFTWLLGAGWERFGGGGILAIALAYICLFIFIGSFLWQRKNLKVPGGLFITMAVCLIPLAVYGFEELTGWWITNETGTYRDFFSWIKGRWFLMELATVVGGCFALYSFRFPFLTAPIYFSLWFMSMDITPIFLNTKDGYWTEHLWINAIFGLGILIVAYLMDQRTNADFSFWGYLFGVLGLSYSLSLLFLGAESEWKRFIYLLIHIGFVLLAILLQRTVFLIFGAVGIFSYMTLLASQYFFNSIFFPFILSLIGILIVFLGIYYHKNHLKIEQAFIKSLPSQLKKWLPRSR